ncbi:MAG: cob(I)yrinic acid a,c-diamide adenosyltransferase, partial [Ruminiclostridium sp.]|nr:cob(I)yrinic acid a,c-diamide adenosyltransferase [Ruminiclostridium sp.]
MQKEKRTIMGLLHIYCGDGKGKTTASIGLAVRAAGAGMKVCFIQLMKGGDTSEIETMGLIPDITVKRCDKVYGFVKNMRDRDKAD